MTNRDRDKSCHLHRQPLVNGREEEKEQEQEGEVGYESKRKVDSALYPLWDGKMSIRLSFGDGAL